MIVKEQLQRILDESLKKGGYKCEPVSVHFSNLPQVADFQCNCVFSLAKELNKNPEEIANRIIANLKYNKNHYEINFCKPAFINIKLKNAVLSKFANTAIQDENITLTKFKKSKTVLIDYGGANVAKELHMGHLRSPIIGESLKRLNLLLGNKVISDTHLGDWGLQMGLTIAQLEEDGMLKYYFGKSKTKPTFTLDILNEAYPKASKRKNDDLIFKKKADDYTLFIQQKKEPYITIYKEMRAVSVKEIKKNYKDLNAFFDLWYGESNAEKYIAKTINLFKEKGLAKEVEGTLIVDVARLGENVPKPKKNPNDEQLYDNPMPPAIIQKYNGAALYVTTDLATIYMRNLSNAPDVLMYITDNRQNLHFIQVFRCAELAGMIPKHQQIIHIGYGTMKGSDGKPFKTRSGETIKLQDIIDLIKNKAQEKLNQNGVGKNDKLALQIGVAALKFGDLSNQVYKDYVLDIDRFMQFEGKTGPYLQYTAARIKSILRKAGKQSLGKIKIEKYEEKQIVVNLMKLIDSYYICYKENTLSSLCTAVYNLASAYSTFYNNVKILTESNNLKRESYLSLSTLTLKALEQALNVLAIDIPAKM